MRRIDLTFSRPFCPNLRFCFASVDMLGLRAWSDDLNVVLFEFLEGDTKLAQSCVHWPHVQHWYTVVPEPPMRVTLWALMEASLRQCTTERGEKVNAWICACQATDRDLESVFVRRKENALICAQSTTDRDVESFNVVRRHHTQHTPQTPHTTHNTGFKHPRFPGVSNLFW